MAGVISLFVVVLVWRFFTIVGETVIAASVQPQRLPCSRRDQRRPAPLVVLIGGLFVFDRLGAIRAISARPARMVARRLPADDTFETWVVVGDRVIAAVFIPEDPERGSRCPGHGEPRVGRCACVVPGAQGTGNRECLSSMRRAVSRGRRAGCASI